MFIVPNDEVSINSNTCSSKSRNGNSTKFTEQCKMSKMSRSEVMQLNYKNKERSINIFGYRLKSEKLF